MKSSLVDFLLTAFLGSISLHAADATPRVVKIKAGIENAMKFDAMHLTAAPGVTNKVVLANATSLLKEAMGLDALKGYLPLPDHPNTVRHRERAAAAPAPARA